MVEKFHTYFSLEIFYIIIMEDCSICFTGTNSWKNLPCQHKLCNSCFLRLDHNKCPFCRKSFNYNKDELKKRNKMNINYSNWRPPSQLVIPEEFTRRNRSNIPIISNNENDFSHYERQIPFSRIERNRIRRRRRNLSPKEYLERRKRIKKRCKMKWNKKNRRAEKISF